MRDVSLAISEAARATDLADIGRFAFPALARALDCCPSFFAEASANLVDSEALAGEHKEVFPEYLRDYNDDPLIQLAAAWEAPVLILEDHLDRRIMRAGRAYNEFHRRHDMEHHMVVRFSGSRLTNPGALVMGFIRGTRLDPFGAREQQIAELVLPALEGAARRIRGVVRPSGSVLDTCAAAARWGLTGAESRVLSVLLSGASNREIARRLFVSVDTVKTHVQRILRKLGVTSRAQAIARLTGQ